MKIVIDVGHGGVKDGVYTTAPSKQAFVNGKWMFEGVTNRFIGGMLGILLGWDGHEVIYTVHPDDPRDLSLPYRVRVANQHPDALFISIHNNAFNGTARGFEIFTSKGTTKSDDLATAIGERVRSLYQNLNLKLRFDFSDGDLDKEADFYVLKRTKGVAVLLECLFFDNPQDAKLLSDVEFLKSLVSAIYHGVNDYIKSI